MGAGGRFRFFLVLLAVALTHPSSAQPDLLARDLVARLCRFRWQIELCFKEWKSYGNLHQFDTANAHIAEGLIWASLCAAVLKRFLAHAAQRMGGRRCRHVAWPGARVTSSTPSSRRCSVVSVFVRRSAGASRTYLRTHDARTRIAITTPAAYGPAWASRDSSTQLWMTS
jgi:hypothetical protein